MTSNSNSKNNDVKVKNSFLQKLINFGTVALIIIIIVGIYKFFIENDYQMLRVEGFDNSKIPNSGSNSGPNSKPKIISDTNTNIENTEDSLYPNTLYEKSLRNLYGTNTRLMCSMLPNIYNSNNVCYINNQPYVPYNFPVHIIKLVDGVILAVFNEVISIYLR